METKKITLSLTDKEFEILRRAIGKYASEQMNKSYSWGKPEIEDDGYAIRANIAAGIQTKLFKKIDRRPELDYVSIF